MFVRAWRHAAAYDPRRGSVPTWLLTIARNLAIDVTRLRGSEPLAPEALLALGLVSPEADPGERDFPADETERLRRAVAALPRGAAPRDRARRVLRAHGPGDRRARARPARHGEDQDPHGDAAAAVRAGG